MNDHSQEPSRGSLWLAVIAIIGCFLLFVGVLAITYLPNRPAEAVTTPVFSAAEMRELAKLAPAEREAKLAELRWDRRVPTPDERKAKLTALRTTESTTLSGYSWIDEEKGIVRLPVQQAMELTIQDLERAKGAR